MNSYYLTATLLNSWGYIEECAKNVKESENDTICLEDKIEIARQNAFKDFLNTLNKVPCKPNEFMTRGIEFEKECYAGNNTCISPIIKGGLYQVKGYKWVEIEGMNILLYGVLDVLKGGVIYDIKRVSRYSTQKYLHSYQHGLYMDLFNNAYKFTYLAYDGTNLHQETYYREQYEPTINIAKRFINWLKENNLFKVYQEKWTAKERKN